MTMITRVTVAVLTRSPFADRFIDAFAATALEQALAASREWPDAIVQIRVAARPFVEITNGKLTMVREWDTSFDRSAIPTKHEIACDHIIAQATRVLSSQLYAQSIYGGDCYVS